MNGPPAAGSDAPADGREPTVAAFVAQHLGAQPMKVSRVHAFATNAVYDVQASRRSIIVKAAAYDALRGEAWASQQAADAGFPAPAVLGFGRLGDAEDLGALIMPRIAGSPLRTPHSALRDVGAHLRRLHDVNLPRFGWISTASWHTAEEFSLEHGSWPQFVDHIIGDTLALADSYPVANATADAGAAAVDSHRQALAALEVGSLCHGDLKLDHVFVDGDQLAGVIDWGDAVIGDPSWDIARFAHRADDASLSLLLEGYNPDATLVNNLTWQLPLYSALWLMVDAIIDHRLGAPAEPGLRTAMRSLAELR